MIIFNLKFFLSFFLATDIACGFKNNGNNATVEDNGIYELTCYSYKDARYYIHLLPHPENCRSFINCGYGNSLHIFNCGIGMIYDFRKCECVVEETVSNAAKVCYFSTRVEDVRDKYICACPTLKGRPNCPSGNNINCESYYPPPEECL